MPNKPQDVTGTPCVEPNVIKFPQYLKNVKTRSTHPQVFLDNSP